MILIYFKDINECGTGNPCPGDHRQCTNTQGSFTCSCTSGYEEATPGVCSGIFYKNYS